MSSETYEESAFSFDLDVPTILQYCMIHVLGEVANQENKPFKTHLPYTTNFINWNHIKALWGSWCHPGFFKGYWIYIPICCHPGEGVQLYILKTCIQELDCIVLCMSLRVATYLQAQKSGQCTSNIMIKWYTTHFECTFSISYITMGVCQE